jgi:hypothetical protein
MSVQVEELKTEKASAVEGLGKKLQEAEEYQHHLEQEHADGQVAIPMSSRFGTNKTVEARFWSWSEFWRHKSFYVVSFSLDFGKLMTCGLP